MNWLSKSYQTMSTDPHIDLGEIFDHNPWKCDRNKSSRETILSLTSLVVTPHPHHSLYSWVKHLQRLRPVSPEQPNHSLSIKRQSIIAWSIDLFQFFFFPQKGYPPAMV